MRRVGLAGWTRASALGVIVAAASLFAGPGGAAALTLEQQRSFSVAVEDPLGFTATPSLAFNRFDKTLGVLTRVEIALSATLTGFAVEVANPNPFAIAFKSYAQLDTLLTLEDHSLIGWFKGAKTGLWKGSLAAEERVTINYSPAFLGAFAPREGAALGAFTGVGDLAFSLGVMPRFDLPKTSQKPDFTSCASEDQTICEARLLSPLQIAVMSNGAVAGSITLTYIYDAPPQGPISAVPAPAAGPMLIAAAFGLFAAARRKRRPAQPAGFASATPRSR